MTQKKEKKLEEMLVVRQDWLESERGWGTRPTKVNLKTYQELLKSENGIRRWS